ncbi:MAG: response regulator, partial [Bdellovibrionales bacterium]|nr:response regulator [Bdellovibrionales bacterium]
MEKEVTEPGSVLVVDDNPLITNVLQSLLCSQSYDVHCCSNGQEALKELERKPVDVIICDVMMPKLDGYGLHDSLRSKPEFSHIPFIFLTALSEDSEKRKGLEAGADDYVVKPFDPGKLLSMVKGKVHRSRSLRSASAEKYDQFRKKIIHTLSHEFRTPLVAINTGTELLLEQQGVLTQDKAHNLLQAIQRGGHRLEKLVNDFMLMQQIEAGIAQRLFENRAAKHGLSEIVRGVLDARKEALVEGEFDVEYVDYCQGADVYVYLPHIQEVLLRFIDNAIKFSNTRKSLEVVICPHDRAVSVEVRDRGMGMNVARVQDAIDAFGQVDRDKLEQQGGGLGLALASRYAKINGGSIELHNREH